MNTTGVGPRAAFRVDPGLETRSHGSHRGLPHERLDTFELLARQPWLDGRNLDQPLRAIEELRRAGKNEAALDAALEVLRDQRVPAPTRAAVAATAALLALQLDPDEGRAEALFVVARQLDPQAPGLDVLEAGLLIEKGQSDEALPLVQRILARAPEDRAWLERYASLLVAESRPAEALPIYERLRTAPPADARRRTALALSHGWALFKATRPAEAVAIFKQVQRDDPQSTAVHSYIRELVLPDFQSPQRPAIEAHFAAANDAFQGEDYAAVKDHARQILALDPDDGLAHHVLVIAGQFEARAAREARAGGAVLMPELADPQQRRALVQQLERITAQARLEGGRRAGTPQDLFPEWEQLTPLQQATIALSVLPYGRLIPALLEAGAVYHFVLPATSGTAVDPQTKPTDKNAFGRCWYTVRGWCRRGFVVTGVEKLSGIARGAHNTVTHEFAHLVHFFVRDLVHGKQPETERVAGLRESFNALYADIETLFAEAKQERNDQRLLEPYSGTDAYEFFAQGMTAYTNPHATDSTETPNRLYGRNPHLWQLCRRTLGLLGSYPARVPAPDPPAVADDADGGAMHLARLLRDAPQPETRTRAGELLRELIAAYLRLDARSGQDRGTGDGAVGQRIAQIRKQAGELIT